MRSFDVPHIYLTVLWFISIFKLKTRTRRQRSNSTSFYNNLTITFLRAEHLFHLPPTGLKLIMFSSSNFVANSKSSNSSHPIFLQLLRSENHANFCATVLDLAKFFHGGKVFAYWTPLSISLIERLRPSVMRVFNYSKRCKSLLLW